MVSKWTTGAKPKHHSTDYPRTIQEFRFEHTFWVGLNRTHSWYQGIYRSSPVFMEKEHHHLSDKNIHQFKNSSNIYDYSFISRVNSAFENFLKSVSFRFVTISFNLQIVILLSFFFIFKETPHYSVICVVSVVALFHFMARDFRIWDIHEFMYT